MDWNWALDAFGYLATVVVAISLMTRNIVKLRWWNLAGALAFTLYGALIGAWPVFTLNAIISAINLYHLDKLRRTRERFDLLHPVGPESELLNLFLDQTGDDFRAFFPEFTRSEVQGGHIVLVLRDLRVMGLFAYRLDVCDGRRCAHIDADYVTPAYRNYCGGEHAVDDLLPRFRSEGVEALVAESYNPAHDHYLDSMGFRRLRSERRPFLYELLSE